jgi:hypothetical protein
MDLLIPLTTPQPPDFSARGRTGWCYAHRWNSRSWFCGYGRCHRWWNWFCRPFRPGHFVGGLLNFLRKSLGGPLQGLS